MKNNGIPTRSLAVIVIVISIVIAMCGHTRRSMIEHAAESQRAKTAERANILTLTTDWSPAIVMEDWQHCVAKVESGWAEEIDILDLKTMIVHPIGPGQNFDPDAIKQFKVRANGEKRISGPVLFTYRIY